MQIPSENVAVVKGITFVFQSKPQTISTLNPVGSDEFFIFADDLEITLTNSVLAVNGKSIGTAVKGDQVIVEEACIYVNGIKCWPNP